MPEMSIFSRWWKQILFIVIISVAVSSTIVFLKPNQYLSMTTAIPGNSLSSDKSRIFDQNIELLYSDLGLPDELDIMVGTAQLDTIYLAVTDEFNLYDHYKIGKNDGEARLKSARRLKKNSRIIKSDYGELKVKVWDTDRNLAPQLANALMNNLEKIHRDILNSNNKKVLETLRKAIHSVQKKIDSINLSADKSSEVFQIRRNAAIKQFEEYTNLTDQYEVIIDADPPSLRVTETARASLWPDKPKRIEIIVATAVLGFLFAFLVSVLLGRRNK